MNNNNRNANKKNSSNNNSNKNLSLEDMTLGKLILELKKNDEFRRNVKTMFEDTNSPLHQDFEKLNDEIANLKKELAELREEVRRHHQEGGDLGTYTPTSETADGSLPGDLNETTTDNSMNTGLPNLYQSTAPTADGNLQEAPFQPVGLSQQSIVPHNPIEEQSQYNSSNLNIVSTNPMTPDSANGNLQGSLSQNSTLQPISGLTNDLSTIAPIESNQSNISNDELPPNLNSSQNPILQQTDLSTSALSQETTVPLNSTPLSPYSGPTFNPPSLSRMSPNSTGGRKKPQQKKKKVVARTVKPKQTAKKINPPKKSKK